MIKLMGLAGALLLIAGSALWSGCALSLLWGWFFVPALGLPELSVPAAIGVALVVGYLTHQYKYEPECAQTATEKLEKWLNLICHAILKPAMVLCMGWIVKQWM